MRKSKMLLCIGVLAMSFIACQKETSVENGVPPPSPTDTTGTGGGTSNGTEQATWNFVSVHLASTLTTEGTYAGLAFKAIGKTDITSTDNQGTVAFDGRAMELQDVAFELDGTTNSDIYSNGIKTFSASAPFQESVPAYSERADYTKVGTDSLHFPNGLQLGGQLAAGPIGAKLKWDGNKMTLAIPTTEALAAEYMGTPMSGTLESVMVITLQKQ